MSQSQPITVHIMSEDEESSTANNVIPMPKATKQPKPRLLDTFRDHADQIMTCGTRAGQTAVRVKKLLDAGVSPKTVASHLSDNSSNGFKYSEDQVRGIEQVAIDSEKKVGVTKRATTALINDQKKNGGNK
ncbi:hypothetical protein [Acinetobacter sp. NS-4]|uniref:hypothetical protein n=1 Tax=Acinetobacter sp. NS-4 TaxID=3127956 RepID=UPI00307D2FAF